MTKTVKRRISNFFVYIILTIIGACFLLPFLWMISTSLKSDQQIFVNPPIWFPKPAQWHNYIDAITAIPFFQYMRNTIFVSVMDVIGTLITCPIVAYGLSRLEWKGRNLPQQVQKLCTKFS